MKSYVMVIQRAFATFWNNKIVILNGPIFCCLKEGLLIVIDTKIRSSQSEGKHILSQNVLSKEVLIHLFVEAFCKEDPSCILSSYGLRHWNTHIYASFFVDEFNCGTILQIQNWK